MPTAKPKPFIYQLKITLLEIDPPIWRRIQVPSTIPLCCLHDALQAVLGWTDSHLHQFEKDGKYWGVPALVAAVGRIETGAIVGLEPELVGGPELTFRLVQTSRHERIVAGSLLH